LCNDWADTLSNGKNLKFSDCNGDGTVDMNDTLAINLNYSQTHSARSGHQIIQASNPDIYLQFDKPRYIRGDTVNASVFIGDASNPQSNFYGAAFNLQYDNSKVQTGTEKFWYNNSWVGNIDQSKIKFSRINPGVGVVDASLVRITHTDTNGFGKVATLSFVLTDSVLVGEMFLTITNAIKTNSSGNISNLNAGTDSLEIVDPTTEIQQVLNKLFSVFPNPATDKISIRSSVELGTIVIYNSLGEVIFQILSKDRQEQIDISKFPAGVYFVEVRNSRVKFIKN
ncbi:MAG: T9SS type A sorting domain-containing protein, partial [Bacteroidia bacterium]